MNQEQDSITLNLPFPISVNSYYGVTVKAKFPIKYVKTKGKEYKEKVKEYVLKNEFDIQANIPLKVHVVLNFPTNHKQDLDNRMKCLLDAITEAKVWEDDSLIDHLTIERGETKKPGSAIVTIQTL